MRRKVETIIWEEAKIDSLKSAEKNQPSSDSNIVYSDEEKKEEMGFLESNKIELKEENHRISKDSKEDDTNFHSKIDIPEKKNSVIEEPSTGGLNNLIRRMTGFKEHKTTRHNTVEEKTNVLQTSQERATERDDESKLDIPAFLRRQAN